MCHILRFKQLFSSVIVFCLGTCEIQIDFLQLVICLFFLFCFCICVAQIQTSVPPGTQAGGSDPLGDLVEKLQEEMNFWLSSQREFIDQQLTAAFGSHNENTGSLNSCYALIFFRLSNGIGLRFRSFLTLHSVIFCKFCINNLCFLLYKHGDKRTYVRKAACKVESVTIKGIHELMEHIF